MLDQPSYQAGGQPQRETFWPESFDRRFVAFERLFIKA